MTCAAWTRREHRPSDPIRIHDDSELAPALDNDSNDPVILERKGAFYRVKALEDDSSLREWDPEAFRRALEEVAGTISEDDADEMIRKIYEYRQTGSRPASRP